MTHPIVKFEGIRQGDTLRWYLDGVSFQAVAEQQISYNTWDTNSGACILKKGSDKVVYLIDRIAIPDTPEPLNIGAVVDDATGKRYVRVPPLHPRDTYVWAHTGPSFKGWDLIAQPVTVMHPGWEQ